MRIKYTFATKETAEIEIDNNTAEIINDLDRIDYNKPQKMLRTNLCLTTQQ
jgi:hypothetical protein